MRARRAAPPAPVGGPRRDDPADYHAGMKIPPSMSTKARSVARQSARGARLAAASLTGEPSGYPARIGRIEYENVHMGAEVARLRAELNALRTHVRLLTAEVAVGARERQDEAAARPGHEHPPFLAHSTPVGSDFSHPRYAQLCRLLAIPPAYHRKTWEWVFILDHLMANGLLREGSRGLGFGVGTEPLPACFAASGVQVVATDSPDPETWSAGDQHSSSIDQLLDSRIAPDAVVRRQVTHQACDMNDIHPSLTDFDFNWSACAFEHLGTIEQGLDFVVNAVERTLRPGGIGVHTTELNLSSDTHTIESGGTVLFRPSDLNRLADRLTERGHHVDPIRISRPTSSLDLHVDTPPYTPIHLRLEVAGYTVTSVGLVVRRGS